MTNDPAVLSEAAAGILTITLNRPTARNAVNRQLAEGVAAALEALDADDDLRVGVITGAGGTFCSGMDLKAFAAGERPIVAGRGFAGIAQRAARKPLIAAVEGYALAGGFEVALACDLIVAAYDARFGIPEVKRGLVAAAATHALAAQIAHNAPLALSASKAIVQRAGEWTENEAWQRQNEIVRPVFGSEDALEGARAFAEKREPRWRAR